jgi:hypothetical protein
MRKPAAEVEGAAGSVKSTALDGTADAATRSGARVIGLAPSRVAADVVHRDAAFPGSTGTARLCAGTGRRPHPLRQTVGRPAQAGLACNEVPLG